MIYEQRIYRAVAGRLPQLLARLQTDTLPLWDKHGIRPVGFFTTLVGESSNDLTYLLAWESLAEREAKWNAFQADPEWKAKRTDSEKNGPLTANVMNSLLTPTAFSALQ
ncbi:MAG: NIPSNAP family protein [Pseudomonadota bacterium]